MTRIIRAAPPRAPTSAQQDASSTRRPPPGSPRVIKGDHLQARSCAEAILEAAHREAEDIVQRARLQAQELRESAEQAGRAEAGALMTRARAEAQRTAARSREELMTLAVQIAQKLLGEQLRLAPEVVRSVVRQCLQGCAASRRVTLRLHPEDLPLVEQDLDELAAAADVEVLVPRGDSSVPRGGCVLETEVGEIDGRLEVQLAAIREALIS